MMARTSRRASPGAGCSRRWAQRSLRARGSAWAQTQAQAAVREAGVPALVHFPSPPGSPVAETPPVLRAAAEEQPKRASPMRKETAGSVVSVGASTKEEGPGKRDVLGERLSRAVLAAKEGKDGKEVGKGRSTSLAPGSSTDAPSPPNQTSSPPSTSTSSRTANSPPTTFNPAARKAFHRRSSSDIVSASARAWLDDKDAVDKKPAPTPAWSDDEKDAELGRDLADMLGGAMALVSRTGELSPPRVASGDALADGWEKSKNGDAQERKDKDKDTMAPIVIKQRSPPPAFSVTSRSAHQQARSVSAYGEVAGVRQRSSTLVPMSAAGPGAFGARTGTGSNSGSVHNSNLTSNSNSNSSNSNSKSTSPSNASSNTNSNADSTSGSNTHSSSAAVSSAANLGARAGKGGVAGNATASSPSSSTTHGLRARPRSSTMMSLQPVVASSPSPPAAASSPLSRPARPFAAPRIERNSPASSTGDSSSGPAAPLTPRDGSDFSEGGGWSGGVSGLGRLAHQRRSVSFDFEEEAGGMGKARAKAKAKPRETPVQEEERRRERRRSEAKAAIELGNVINGRGPIADDDDEDGRRRRRHPNQPDARRQSYDG
ncbi:hypothetical protein B0H10DRAFT_1315204 [Mycena sp. CBHHK59/15]|nr:hypothetical protein B0H10DRAFT_1315204 [Mycena sp. CBHHK59/15]